LIESIGITKRYGNNIAVQDLNFIVNEHEVVGFLGPNGAGKSTTMNIITGYINLSEGDVRVNGISVVSHCLETKKLIGYLPETPPLYANLSVIEYLNFVCDLKKANKKSVSDLLERLNIKNVKDKLISNLSKGYKQRVGLAQALFGEPKVLILDEPASGLDPKQIIEIRDLIKSLKQDHTVLLSSHNLSEVSAVADRIIIINKGEIVANGTPDELAIKFMQSKKIIARVRGDLEKILSAINSCDDFKCEIKHEIELGCLDLILESKSDGDLREKFFNFARENNFIILMLKPYDFSLEEIFLEVTQEFAQKQDT